MFIPAIFDEDFAMPHLKNNIYEEMCFIPSRVRDDSFDFASQKQIIRRKYKEMALNKFTQTIFDDDFHCVNFKVRFFKQMFF